MIRRLICTILACFAIAANPAEAVAAEHDFHVCITQIDYRPATGTLEFTVKIFTDDLESSLEGLGAPRLNIGGKGIEHPATDSLIAAYLGNRLKVTSGSELPLAWIGKEVELDATWCYMECKVPPGVHEISLMNRILFERFDDQMNIVHFAAPAGKQSFMLDPSNGQVVIKF